MYAAVKAYRERFKERDPIGYAKMRRDENRRRMQGPNRERLLAQKRAYNVANWATLGKSTRDAWRKRNWPRLLGVYNAYWHKRRALSVNAEGHFTEAEWKRIVENQHGRCFDCGEERKLTVGHLVPLCKDGSNWPENIVGQCQRCNSKQGQKLHPSVGG